MQVHRRLVIYVQGYDPRGLAEYYRMFRREYRRTCELYGLTGKIGRAQERSRALHHLLGRDHRRRRLAGRHALLVSALGRHHPRGFRAPGLVEDRTASSAFSAGLINGVFVRIAQAHWRFGRVHRLPNGNDLLGFTLAAAAVAAADVLSGERARERPCRSSSLPLSRAAYSSFLIRLTESRTYLLYLCDDFIATRQFATHRRPGLGGAYGSIRRLLGRCCAR